MPLTQSSRPRRRQRCIRLAGVLALCVASGSVVLTTTLAASGATAAEEHERATGELHRVVTLLQYIGEEYDEALEEGVESEILEQQKLVLLLGPAASTAGQRGRVYEAKLASIAERVAQRADPVGVSRDCAELARDIVAREGIATYPTAPPDLARGRAVWSTVCASCHDRATFLARPDSAAINPPPPTFFEADIVNHLSPFRAFDFVTYGIPGTAMAPFGAALNASDRWAVAFYLHTLRQPPCDGPRPSEPLARTSTMTDQEIVVAHGERGLACLRWAPSEAPATAVPARSPGLRWHLPAVATLVLVGAAITAAIRMRRATARAE